MNREELNTLFYNIAQGKTSSFTVGQNKQFRAILDIDPISEGHILIIPKRNVIEFTSLTPIEILSLHKFIKKMSSVLHSKYSLTGISIMQNGGSNNEINYLHIHLIPRRKKDGFAWRSKKQKFNLAQIQTHLVSK